MRHVAKTESLLVCLLAFGLVCSAAQADVTISLSVSPSTPTSGAWPVGGLVEVIIQAESDGLANQGFAGADFKTGDFALSVEASLLKIHDILYDGTTVNTEQMAGILDGSGGYLKAEDTWVYDDFTDFVASVDMGDGSFEAVASAQLSSGYGLGIGGPVDFLHVVFEIQPGLDIGESADVTFYGQVTAYNVTPGPGFHSNIFGTPGSSINEGTFALTRVPEPSTLSILLVGMGLAFIRGRKRC